MLTTTIIRLLLPTTTATATAIRTKTTSAAAVSSRHRDPTFEKLMLSYKHYQKLLPIFDLILSSPSLSLPLPHLLPISHRLRIHRGPHHFLRLYPHLLSFSPPLLRLTPLALSLSRSASAASSASAAADRLVRLLSMSASRSVPLRAVFRLWRELGLPDDFEDSVLKANCDVFSVRDNPKERNTHILELVGDGNHGGFVTAVEEWRRGEMGKEGIGEVDAAERR